MTIGFRIFFVLAGIFFTTLSVANEGYQRLFKSDERQISLKDKKAIYDAMEIGKDADDPCGAAEYESHINDLNGDGIPEVFILGGNSCTSGVAGSSVWLFIKSSPKGYLKNLGFPAAAYTLLSDKSLGFPDIQLGGPGFCEGVWRWNGKAYAHYKDVPTEKGGCDYINRLRSQ